MTTIEIEVKGLKEAGEKFAKFPGELVKSMEGAGIEATGEILGTVGVQTYPAATPANFPPTPYYKRGLGTQYASHNDGSSEQYGKQWTTVAEGYETVSQNTASYAKYLVHDELQAVHMAIIGWRKLGDVYAEKRTKIVAIYQAWVQRAIEALGL